MHGFRDATKLLSKRSLLPLEPQQQKQLQQQQAPLLAQQLPEPAKKLLGLLSNQQQHHSHGAGAQQVPQPEQEQDLSASSSNSGDYMALLAVSLLWGSYAPALRYLYNMDTLLTPQVGFRLAHCLCMACMDHVSSVSLVLPLLVGSVLCVTCWGLHVPLKVFHGTLKMALAMYLHGTCSSGQWCGHVGCGGSATGVGQCRSSRAVAHGCHKNVVCHGSCSARRPSTAQTPSLSCAMPSPHS